jgi:hypothetical protein
MAKIINIWQIFSIFSYNCEFERKKSDFEMLTANMKAHFSDNERYK